MNTFSLRWAALWSVLMVPWSAGAADLEQAFRAPAQAAQPRTYWFHMRGNITKAGITADLEAMKEMGLAGTLFMNVSVGVPEGLVQTQDFMSPSWQDCFQHMLNESARLGLDFGSALCDGWGNAGGPEIPPELAMQQLTWSETRVQGGQTVEIAKLAQPTTLLDYYRQVAVLALPLSAAECAAPPPAQKKIRLVRSPTGPVEVRFAFPAPVTACELTLSDIHGQNPFGDPTATLEAGDDGKNWRTVKQFPTSWRGHPRTDLTVAFDPVTAKHFRLLYPVGGYFRNSLVTIGAAALSNRPRIHYWQAKAAIISHNEHGGGAPRFLDAGAGDTPGVPLAQIVNLSGKQRWTAPAGEWLVLRVGHTPTGAHNAPATKAGVGLECDKLNPAGVEAQQRAFIDRVLAAAKPAARKAFKHTWIDSWEVGPQNWTARFAAEFQARRGYDITAWLPVLCGGRVVVSRDQSERLLWDFRRTIADMFVDYYWRQATKLAHARGIEFRAESFGRQQFMYDVMNYARANHMPCGEFWVGGGPRVDCKAAASAAHLSGRQIAGAEAFTAGRGNWLDDPWSLKTLGDRAFCLGVNQYYFHRYAHQPWLKLAPGMPFGPYGINFERTNTWWKPGRAWVEYITRCQSLLQQGRFVADVLVMLDEGAPTYGGWRSELALPLPAGFDYDFGNLDALRESRVEKGRIVHKNGMNYRLLMLPGTGRATPALLREVLRLAQAGAAVATPRPLARAHGRASDAEVAGLWKQVAATGRLCVTQDFHVVAKQFALTPDFQFDGPADLLWIHRTDDAGADWYFLSNQSDMAGDVHCTFRVSGRQPELWDAATGTRRSTAQYAAHDKETTVLIPFAPRGSWFVVFRRGVSPLAVAPPPPAKTPEPKLPAKSPGIVDNFTILCRAKPAVEIDLQPTSAQAWFSVARQNHVVRAEQGELMFGAGHVNMGLSVGTNGVAVWEHGARYRPMRIAAPTPLSESTHIAVVYRDRQPTLYVSGKPAGTATPSQFKVHPGCLGAFKGTLRDLELIARPLSDAEVAAHAAKGALPASTSHLWIVDGRRVEEKELPDAVSLDTQWNLAFQPGRGAPPALKLDRLADLAQQTDPAVKHFSGTIVYRKTFARPPAQAGETTRYWLDLGTVANLAEVFVNGRNLGVLWKRPFRVDVTDALRDGTNQLEIHVTNLWVNRLIGDLPKMAALGVAYQRVNGAIIKWPDWVPRDAPPADAPVSFAGWRQWQAGDPLQPTGLIGPVRLGQSRLTPVGK